MVSLRTRSERGQRPVLKTLEKRKCLGGVVFTSLFKLRWHETKHIWFCVLSDGVR